MTLIDIGLDLAPDSHKALDLGRVNGLVWQRLLVSPVGVAVLAKAGDVLSEGEVQGGQLTALKNAVRDCVCDLGDTLTAFGLRLPLALVIACRELHDYDLWHRIAGDQDWHRGSFAVMPFFAELYRDSGISCAEALAEELVNARRMKVSEFKLESLDRETYGHLLTSRLTELRRHSDFRKYDGNLYAALIDTIVSELRGPQPEKAADLWVEHVVLPSANQATAPEPTPMGAEKE